jgi:hypothetical protein
MNARAAGSADEHRLLPTFSVVIPAFNAANSLSRAIDSVLAQDGLRAEILVVDDASNDATATVAASYGSAIRYLRQSRNQGVAAARNRGAAEACGEWLAFLDADDWFHPERLITHARWIADDPTLDFLTADYCYVDADGKALGRSLEAHPVGRILLDRSGKASRALLEVGDIEEFVADHIGDTHTLSVPRAQFLALGGYPVGYRVCEDVHLLVRLIAASTRIGVSLMPLATYVVHAASATRRDPVAAQRENVRTLCDLARLAGSFPAPVARGVARRLHAARMNLAYALLRNQQRIAALRAVLPSLRESPGWRILHDVLSVLKG